MSIEEKIKFTPPPGRYVLSGAKLVEIAPGVNIDLPASGGSVVFVTEPGVTLGFGITELDDDDVQPVAPPRPEPSVPMGGPAKEDRAWMVLAAVIVAVKEWGTSRSVYHLMAIGMAMTGVMMMLNSDIYSSGAFWAAAATFCIAAELSRKKP